MCWVLPAGNQIGDAGARALADGLKGLEGLKELYLGSKCVIGRWVSCGAQLPRTHDRKPAPVVGVAMAVLSAVHRGECMNVSLA